MLTTPHPESQDGRQRPTAEWPLVLYFVTTSEYKPSSAEPKLETILAKPRGKCGFAYAERHQFLGYRSSTRVKQSGTALTAKAAWERYAHLQHSRIQRGKEQIVLAELRLKQISKHL